MAKVTPIAMTTVTMLLALVGASAFVTLNEDGIIAAPSCCRYCSGNSKACGDACINVNYTCHQPPGCACNGTAPPSPPPDPSYDHQTKAYHSSFKPLILQNANLEITPFFSPDHSADTTVEFVNAATATLDIITPSFSSWSGCTSGSGCVGCHVSTCNNEKFPMFPAILNAVHRGVAVRIITNNFGDETCDGDITPFDFLALNGVKIGFYTSTTFAHAKFMMRDGKAASISSVNWSRSSYLKNREAGAVIEGDGKDTVMVISFVTQVFEADWKQTTPYKVRNTYSASDMAVITNKTLRPVDPPEGPSDRPYITPKPTPISINAPVTVTDSHLCQWLLDAHQRNVEITMLVSRYIYGAGDQSAANSCYKQLFTAGIKLHRAWQFGMYMYNHQKFWIVDGKRVSFSTGNWSPSDYPVGNGTYPPYGVPGWQSTNRDFTMSIEDTAVVETFDDVIMGDWKNSTKWYPPSSEEEFIH